jgi:hypothetical protein
MPKKTRRVLKIIIGHPPLWNLQEKIGKNLEIRGDILGWLAINPAAE